MKIWSSAMALCLCFAGSGAMAHRPVSAAVFDFDFEDTSLQGELQGTRSDERQRLASLDLQLRSLLISSGCCVVAGMEALPEPAQRVTNRSCNDCNLDRARTLGASVAVTGWVQKVSNLILNMNVVVRDVASGAVIRAGSVDLRGNTDESWSRGLTYLMHNRLHPSEW